MRTQPDPSPAALYARVSSDRQDVGLSVAAQLRALRNYSQSRRVRADRAEVEAGAGRGSRQGGRLWGVGGSLSRVRRCTGACAGRLLTLGLVAAGLFVLLVISVLVA